MKNETPKTDIEIALDESLKLQAHYAKLLNMWDGGNRMIFKDRQSWIDRLKATGTIRNEDKD